jgi:3-methyl-2-oxobutanoate hydroxymethyltransferase
LHEDAQALTAAGIDLLVLEMVPAALAAEVTGQIAVPTIGIGAGSGCSGQVLVLYDMLGIYPGKPARFVRNFMAGGSDVEGAVAAYVKAVKDGSFPGPEHCV